MNFKEAVEFFDDIHGWEPVWSIQYYGFGEHFTFWRGDGTFDDFHIDHNTPITWEKLKEIIIKSAESKMELDKKNENVS